MNLMRLKAITKKEFIQIYRDPRSLGMAVAIPMLLLVLFGYALTLDVDNVPIVIWDQDKSSVSRDFILNFKNSPYFNIIGYCDNYRDIEMLIDTNKAIMALIIPVDFSKLIRTNKEVGVQLLVDGSDSNTATIATGYVNSIVSAYNKNCMISATQKVGLSYTALIDMRARVWFNTDLKSRNYIIPGLIAVIMMVIAALLTSLTVAREWDRGTMEQLISTPVTSYELIAGKFIPYFAIAVFDVLVAVLMGQFVFRVPFRGSVVLLFALSCLFLTGALCLGILISIVTKTQFLASQLAFITSFLPAFLLSGFAFPISNMPNVIRQLTYLIPTRYFVVILKGIYLKGVGLKILAPQVILLMLFALVVVVLANRKLQKKVA